MGLYFLFNLFLLLLFAGVSRTAKKKITRKEIKDEAINNSGISLFLLLYILAKCVSYNSCIGPPERVKRPTNYLSKTKFMKINACVNTRDRLI